MHACPVPGPLRSTQRAAMSSMLSVSRRRSRGLKGGQASQHSPGTRACSTFWPLPATRAPSACGTCASRSSPWTMLAPTLGACYGCSLAIANAGPQSAGTAYMGTSAVTLHREPVAAEFVHGNYTCWVSYRQVNSSSHRKLSPCLHFPPEPVSAGFSHFLSIWADLPLLLAGFVESSHL